MSKKNVRLESLFILSEIISPSSDREKIKQEIRSDSIDWLNVVEIANTHFLTAALYYSLLDKDLLNFIDDEELLTYLEQIYTINLHRNQKIIEQSKEIAQILLKKDIKPVFLKGAASLLQNDYKDVGMRFLSDIDFCVFENDFVKAKDQLLSSGYIPNIIEGIEDIGKHHHWWPMYHPSWDIMIEPHRFILGFPLTQVISCNKKTYHKSISEKNIYVLTPTFRLVHAYLHSDLIDENYYTFTIDLRQLFEISILIQQYQNEIDWKYIKTYFNQYNLFTKFNFKLNLIYMLFKIDTPITCKNVRSNFHIHILLRLFKHVNYPLIKFFRVYRRFLLTFSYRTARREAGAINRKMHIIYIVDRIYKLTAQLLHIKPSSF